MLGKALKRLASSAESLARLFPFYHLTKLFYLLQLNRREKAVLLSVVKWVF